MGPGHYLKEKDESSPEYQPGSRALSTFKVTHKTAQLHILSPLAGQALTARFVAAGLFCLSQQVFADGEEPAKRPLNGIFADAAKEPAVSTDVSLLAGI